MKCAELLGEDDRWYKNHSGKAEDTLSISVNSYLPEFLGPSIRVSCTPGSNRIPYEQCDMSHTALLKYICSAYLSEWTSVAVPNIHSMCTQHLHPCAVCEMWYVTVTSKKKQQHSFYSSRTLSIVIAVIINTMSAQTQTKLTDNK